MKIETYDEFLELIRPTHEANLQTMRLLVSLKWFQKKVKRARKTAGWPSKGYKIGDKRLFKKTGKKSYSFIPKAKLVSNPEKHTKYKKIVSEVIRKACLPEHFKFHVDGYILYNWVSAPVTSFSTRHDPNSRIDTPSFSLTKWYSNPHGNDVKLALDDIEVFRDGFPPLQTRKFKYKPKLSNYIKNAQIAKRVKSQKNEEYELTNKDVATEIFGVETEKPTKRKANLISQQQKRLNDALKERGFTK